MTQTPMDFQLGLIGYPLGHSRSPALHQAALRACGLRGAYRLLAAPPDAAGDVQIRAWLEDMRVGRLHGLNVTIPHKQRVMAWVDRLTEAARQVGAVNTLYLAPDGSLVGDNTDAPAFLEEIHARMGALAGRAVVLGAGGSARAVTAALVSAGWQVRVLARRAAQAEGLIGDLRANSAALPVNFPTATGEQTGARRADGTLQSAGAEVGQPRERFPAQKREAEGQGLQPVQDMPQGGPLTSQGATYPAQPPKGFGLDRVVRASWASAGEQTVERLRFGALERDTLAALDGAVDLLVNTTPLGMSPHGQGCPWPEDLPLPVGCAVYDLVYNPPATVLVQRARQAGLPAWNGAGMLIAQAGMAFTRWTGCVAPRAVMEAAFSVASDD